VEAPRGRVISCAHDRDLVTRRAQALRDPDRDRRGARDLPVWLIADRDGWAPLYVPIGDAPPAVATFDRDGHLRATYPLPADLEPLTLDLGVNARGLFVTWLDGATAHVIAIGGGRERRRRIGRAASYARAIGVDDRCALASIDRDEQTLRIDELARCP